MRRRVLLASCLTALVSLGASASASASTQLGVTAQPSGSSSTACGPSNAIVYQATSSATPAYRVPAAGGRITEWKISTTGATAGGSVTFVVLRPASGGSYTVVAATFETLPNPLPASGVATFPVPTPISVLGGDTLGLYGGVGAVTCYWNGGSVPAENTLGILAEPSAPQAGQTLNPMGSNSPSGFELNLAATLEQSVDAAVTTGSAPTTPTVGNLMVLASTVTNSGPTPGPITFTDVVPAGLTVNSAVAAGGTCSQVGNSVSCTVSDLGVGQTAPVSVVVTPSIAKSYVNTVTVAPAGG